MCYNIGIINERRLKIMDEKMQKELLKQMKKIKQQKNMTAEDKVQAEVLKRMKT